MSCSANPKTRSVARDFPRSVFFSSKLVFQKENAFSRFLHNHTPATLQQKLQFAGLDVMILPIRVFADANARRQSGSRPISKANR
jgi:hypothetical protein